MILVALTLLRASITVPEDLVDLLHARHGFAFVGQSARIARPEFGRQRGEVQLANLARSRWDLKTDLGRGFARGFTVPSVNLLNADATLVNYPGAEAVPPKRFTPPGGAFARVDELLRGVPDPPKVHWVLARRYVSARFKPTEGLSPEARVALAGAIAGRYDAKTRAIDIDPIVFRAQAVATIGARLGRADRTEGLRAKDGLTLAAFEAMSDAELTTAYSTPSTTTQVAVPDGFRNPRVVQYIEVKLKELRRNADGSAEYVLSSIDPEVAPFIYFRPVGGTGIGIKKKGSDARLIF